MTAVVTALKEYGCDVDGAIERLLNREEMYIKFLNKFMQDSSYAETVAAVEAGDAEASCKAVHSLKGVAGNLGLTPLFNKASDMVNTYRAQDQKGADAMLPDLTVCYDEIMDILNSNI